MHKVRGPFENADDFSRETGLACTGDSMTKQEFAEESDMNNIVKQFGLTGQLPDNIKVPLSGDFTDAMTYQESLNAVIAADDAFMALDAKIRERFGNSPAKLMEFLADEKNRDEARKFGLLVPVPTVPEPVKVRVMKDDDDDKKASK